MKVAGGKKNVRESVGFRVCSSCLSGNLGDAQTKNQQEKKRKMLIHRHGMLVLLGIPYHCQVTRSLPRGPAWSKLLSDVLSKGMSDYRVNYGRA